jgi:hypothetical protein
MSAQPVSPVKQTLLAQLREQLLPQLDQLVHDLPEQLLDFARAEAGVRAGMLELARRLLGLWAQAADPAADRPRCEPCGLPMRHKGLLPAALVSTLGPVRYRRPRWRCEGCGAECYPHDRALRFGGHGATWALARVCGRLAAEVPSFARARAALEEDYRVHLATETVRTLAEEAGQRLLRQEDERRAAVAGRQAPLPACALAPDKAYVLADGTMIHAQGDWHEIRVNTVATEDADGLPLQRLSQARFLPPEELGWLLALMARQAGYHNARLRAFIADGAAWLWKLQEQFFGGAIAILDWYHLAQKVHQAANGLYGEGSAPAGQWAAELKSLLWDGQAEAALERVRQQEARARSPAKREAVHALRTYLENQRGHLDYPRYRELGLSVGSGQVEAQCKCLVGGRCKQAGMRDWTYAGAEAVLRLRAARQDGTFDMLWERHLRLAA